MNNIKKDIPRGTYRVAEGASVLGDGSKPEHHSHVRKTTALETKIRELQSDTETPDINPVRQQRTTRLRRDKDIKPI